MAKTRKIRIAVSSNTTHKEIFNNLASSEQPLDIDLNDKTSLPKLSEVLQSKVAGDKFELTLEPKDAFGEYSEDAVKGIPKSDIPKNLLQPGAKLTLDISGNIVDAEIQRIDDEHAYIDLNHPLAGHTLTVNVEVLA